MSTNESSSLPDGVADARAMALRQAGLLEAQEGGWPVATAPLPQPPSTNVARFLHALRRHWVLAVAIGGLCAVVAAPAVYYLRGARYTATSYLKVEAREPQLVFPTASTVGVGLSDFDIYKNTQGALVTNDFVLTAALRDRNLSKFVESKEDPIVWLKEEIRVVFLRNSELMAVSLTGKNEDETTKLVNAVVNAYLTEVVNRERNARRERLEELKDTYGKKAEELKSKRTSLKNLADQFKTSDKETASLKQQLAVQEYAEYRNERIRLQFDLRRTLGQLKAQQALLLSAEETPISDYELDAAAWADPIAKQLALELIWRTMDRDYVENYTQPTAKSPHVGRYRIDVDMVQELYDSRELELREGIKSRKRTEIEAKITLLQAEAGYLQEQVTAIEVDVEARKKEADRFGSTFIDIEMMRREVQDLDRVVTGIAEEREKLAVEIGNQPRVVPMPGGARPEETGGLARWMLTILAGMAGLCIPAVCIAWWDTRWQRINTITEVSKGLGLPVIGSVPMIPARIITQLGSPSRRNQLWRMRLTESADSIAASLLRKAELDQTRVILVTSAGGGEGKTTLATQLTMSLARNGRRTVLVDFDLRRPSFHDVFGLPLAPGVCEALRGENDLAGLDHATGTENLSVVTAGRWDRHALAALANAAAGPLFQNLRERFEFVVVDASPVLPVADTRFVSQHVDAVILSVFRDVSQAPKVQAACEILEAFGVRALEAVVTGPSEELRDKDLDYESALPA